MKKLNLFTLKVKAKMHENEKKDDDRNHDHGQQWFHLWTSGATSPKRSLCGFAVRTILQVAVVLIHEDDVSSSNLGNDFLHQKGKINDGYSSKFWPYNNEPLMASSKVSLFLKFLNKKHREETWVRGTMAAVATKHSFLAAKKALEKWVCFWYF